MAFPLLGAAGAVSLGELLKALMIRFLLVMLVYLVFNTIFTIAGSMFVNSDLFMSLLGRIHGGQTLTVSEAFSIMPPFVLQLFFFMHLNEALSMVGATVTAVLGLKLYGKILDSIGI